ncbi:hypothetical protein D3C72_1330490 [compost metagenome]
MASPQPMPSSNCLRNTADSACVANARYSVYRCELSASLASPGARESVTIRITDARSALAPPSNSGMVLL